MKKSKTLFILVWMLIYCMPSISKAQGMLNQVAAENNYYVITQKLDSLFTLNPDTAEGGETKAYERWKWFWDKRINNSGDPGENGTFSQYAVNVENSLNNPQFCKTSALPQHNVNWQLLGPIEYEKQHMGRVDVVKTDPINSSIIYAGAPASGLWRCLNKNATKPVWQNITDNIKLPAIGIYDLVINPNNNNEAWLSAGIAGWGRPHEYGIGIFKTYNLQSSQPDWFYTPLSYSILGENSFSFKKIILFPSNSNKLVTYNKQEVYYSVDAGINWTGINVQNNFIPFFEIKDIEIDPNNNNIVYISGLLDKTYNKLFRYDITNTNSWQVITQNLNFTTCDLLDKNNPIRLTRTNTAVYVMYKKGMCSDDFAIEKTTTFGNSFSTLSQPSGQSINPATPVFEVSNANENIIYVEKGPSTRQLLKSVNGGISFTQITSYGYNNNTIDCHMDIRGFELTNPSINGLNDEVLVGNDGGILYSKETLQNGFIDWKNINGTGLAITQFYGLGVSQKRSDNISGGCQDNGVFTLFEGNWIRYSAGDGYDIIFEKNTAQNAFMQWSSGSINNHYVYHSSDYGQIFTALNPYPPGYNKIKPWHYMEQPWHIDEEDDFYFTYFDLYKTKTSPPINWQPLSKFSVDHDVDENNLIKSFAVYPPDKNIIYVAFEHALGTLPLEKKLFKTTNGLAQNPIWEDITSNISTTQSNLWNGISDVIVSLTNPQKVWLGFDGFWESNGTVFNRVNYSSNGGNTWTDITANLPNLPVNKLIYLEGSNDGIFLANDIGVYYTDNALAAQNPAQRWICINTGLPYTIVTDLDINYCNKTLSISTFGRGIWQTDISNFLTALPKVIATNTSISGNYNLNSDLLIKAGNTLTITGEVRVAKDKKIMVEQGARLLVDGGTITNYCHMWEGIEVWGDKTKNQFGTGNQGIVELKNGATIENAMLGIRTWQSDANGNVLWNTTGGIVKAANATFRNCKHGVSIFPYHNTLPNGNPANNLSRFTNCSFITDDVLKIPNTYPGQMITLYDVEGILIQGCTFQNVVPNLYPEGGRGKGIVSADASYRVIPFCNSMTFPCPQNALVPNTFNNLYKGIEASAIAGVAKIQIDKNEFTNNTVGIRIAGAGYAEITNNTFEIPLSPNYIQFGGNTFGIFTEASYGHIIENNTFTTTGLEIVNHTNYAIVSENTMFGGADIYRNTFNNTVVGLMVQQDNAKLIIDCNTHNNGNSSLYDWAVASGDLADQGQCLGQNGGYPAKNDFVKPCTDAQNIYHWSQFPPFPPIPAALVYQYKDQPQDEPECRTIPEVYAFPCQLGASTNPCLAKISGPGAVALKPAINALKQSSQELQTLIDGGSTLSLLNTINSNATPGQIKNTLMSASPYLSDAVLIAMLQKNPSLPHGHIKEIIIANSPITLSVMQVLNTKNLPNGIKNEIQNTQTGISERRLLEAEINATETEVQSMINTIVRYYLDSAYIDSAVAYLTVQGNTEARCAIVPICLRYHTDTLVACTHLAVLSSTADSLVQTADSLRGNELRSFCDFYSKMFHIKFSEGGYFSLSTADSILLRNLSLTQSSLAVNAQNLFNLVYGEDTLLYAEPLNVGNNLRKGREQETNKKSETATLIKCYPNPFTGSTQIEISLAEEESAVLQITDISGKILKDEKVTGSTIITIRENELAPGIYLCRLLKQGKLIAKDKLVKIN